jgi:hypothetical protein
VQLALDGGSGTDVSARLGAAAIGAIDGSIFAVHNAGDAVEKLPTIRRVVRFAGTAQDVVIVSKCESAVPSPACDTAGAKGVAETESDSSVAINTMLAGREYS